MKKLKVGDMVFAHGEVHTVIKLRDDVLNGVQTVDLKGYGACIHAKLVTDEEFALMKLKQ